MFHCNYITQVVFVMNQRERLSIETPRRQNENTFHDVAQPIEIDEIHLETSTVTVSANTPGVFRVKSKPAELYNHLPFLHHVTCTTISCKRTPYIQYINST